MTLFPFVLIILATCQVLTSPFAVVLVAHGRVVSKKQQHTELSRLRQEFRLLSYSDNSAPSEVQNDDFEDDEDNEDGIAQDKSDWMQAEFTLKNRILIWTPFKLPHWYAGAYNSSTIQNPTVAWNDASTL
jgi:hypothetical protein